MRDYLGVAVEAARLGGDVLKQSFGNVKQIEYKGEANIVTEVDKRSEKLIVELLLSRFPKHSILGEEGTNLTGSSGLKWIIDPLDGTTNYAHDYPIFCVSVALEEHGEIIVGAIYQPIFDELFTAEKGKGAYLNGRQIRVSRVSRLRESLLSTGFPYDVLQDPTMAMRYFASFVDTAQAVRRDGSAALDLCYVAMGRFDAFWEVRLKPWDSAAGVLIVAEAGGKVTDFQGGAYSVYGEELMATNAAIHTEMLHIFQRVKQRP